ncbi:MULTISPECIES: ABC transporter ATP-binding protein [Clostridium]|uniref:HMP/thiamine import ATP-binding protein YkoD n=3 Tax=Clostridium TaxID=1485 RepID=D8GKF1_CLOLD|nr:MULTISPECIES: energy-coupling factor transporter ATPase [Clostridium]ADK15291.1 predicted ABC cobalt transport protein, ATPase component [Clostridium ljungdahlii DSM 13528]AGY74561.1 energy-coupling factor transporter ATPase [Clostridium autoethanogenum DSM 10061]ALU34747.1 ABC-type transporter [Clostridium autoethanogenum DSM 10061]OAA88773.1 putative HMP/thiamine import ATP-binding protein YkoD [Clostridium ljungdahlii DSM 13528]OVY51466.1 putative HMP/thiamine import ATP-binding protein 
MSYIEINNLNFTYPLEKHRSLKDINLSLEKNDFLLIAGRSGSGKSTLARAIVGTVPNFYGGTIGGEIKIDGELVNKMSHKERAKKITMVFQDPEKQLVMNKVHREIAFGLENIGADEGVIKRRVYEALQFSGILHLAERDVTSLSGGEKQKVAVASALVYMPRCIILDEPTSQLDPSSAEEMLNLVKKINQELGITVIVIEQRVNRWFDTVDSIAIMNDGTLELFKDKKDFYDNCNQRQYMFMPDYLKLFKKLDFNAMPQDFKDARVKILNSSLKLKEKDKSIFQENDEAEVLSVKKMGCKYGSKKVLNNLNFNVKKGEFISIMGANGAGKSTLLKCIMGLKNYEGTIKLYGKDISKMDIRQIAKHIGYVSQNPNDYLSKESVYEEVKFTMDNYGIYDEKVIENILKELEIYDLREKNPRDLSGGQRQRVAIATILVLQPDMILLDEPTRGLESGLKYKLGKLLEKLNKKGTSIVLITHDTDFASNFCKRYMIMFNGAIVADGDKKQVLGDGIFYTTSINKLLRDREDSIFTLEEALGRCEV